MAEEKNFSTILSAGQFDSLTPNPGVGVKQGLPVKVGSNYALGGDVHVRVPGMASIGWIPTFGAIANADDPLNVSLVAIQSKMRKAMHRVELGWDASDTVQALLAADSLFILYRLIVRGYNCLDYVDPLSVYGPHTLFRALRLNYDDFAENKPNIEVMLKKWSNDAAEIPIPRAFPLMDEHTRMTDVLFADSNDMKRQIYAFSPTVLWSWDGFVTNRHLTPVRLTELEGDKGYMSWSQLKTTFSQMLSALMGSEDFQKINAGFQSAYTDSDAFKLEAPADTGTAQFEIVADKALLNCVNNALLVGIPNSEWHAATFAPYSQSGNTVTLLPVVAGTSVETELDTVYGAVNRMAFQRVFNACDEAVTSPMAVQFSRWHPVLDRAGADEIDSTKYGDETQSEQHFLVLRSQGTDVLTHIEFIGPLNTEGKPQPIVDGINWDADLVASGADVAAYAFDANVIPTPANNSIDSMMGSAVRIMLARAFNHAPLMLWNVQAESGLRGNPMGGLIPFIDWKNMYVLNEESIAMHHLSLITGAFDSTKVKPTTPGASGGTGEENDTPNKRRGK